MKTVFFCLVLFLFTTLVAQEGIQFGAQVNASWKLNVHRSKTVPGIWAAENGYGFTGGIPIRIWTTESSSFNTGVNYEYTAFDTYAFNQLQSSFRFHGLSLPLYWSNNVTKNWYFNYGGGVNYNFSVNSWSAGFNQSVKDQTNKIQPNLLLGISSLTKRTNNWFDLGFNMRLFFIDIWKKGTTNYETQTNKLLVFDFSMKYLF